MKNLPTIAPRLKVLYKSKLVKELQTELGLSNIHQVPVLEKIVISSGTGKHKDDKRYYELVSNNLSKVTGQAPIGKTAKKSIATYKIRKGQGSPIGLAVTLRGGRMYEFLDRFINVSLPRVRDFHGVRTKAFDRDGNYSLGISEQSIFPELSFEDTQTLHGLEVTFVIKNGSTTNSRLLLSKFGLPFEKGKE
jgi:large subunit ribosomal protein L5